MNSSRYVGIDLGTANTLVYTKGKGISVREPSMIAFEQSTSKVIAVGSEAKKMLGKTPDSIKTLSPIKDGVIADFEFCSDMLCEFIKKGFGPILGFRPKVMVCIPFGITEVEKRAVLDSILEAGASSVETFEEPLCAALGAGLPIMSEKGSMIVDIGAGTSEIAILSHGGIVTSSSVKIAGNTFDKSIISYIKQEFNVLIGQATAEEIKTKIGSAHPSSDIGVIEVKGRNMRDGKAAEFILYSAEVREAIQEPLAALFEAIRSVLDSAPPEICADIYDNGITLSGGGALLKGLNFYFHDISKVNIRVAENPLECVICGIRKLIEEPALRNKIESIGLHSVT